MPELLEKMEGLFKVMPSEANFAQERYNYLQLCGDSFLSVKQMKMQKEIMEDRKKLLVVLKMAEIFNMATLMYLEINSLS